ncbi:MAG: hypothetical protein GY934_02400, partial [Gammaproteobacteria bacterium]|nr:hypothetical protein [Gammaproteobacteria bacterium]
MLDALDIPDPAYMQQQWYQDLAPLQQELCRKNPTEDAEWRRESFTMEELPLAPESCQTAAIRERIHQVLVVQQGNEITNRGPVVLVSRGGGAAGRTITEWERETQGVDLLRSSGSVEPVTIQAITRTYDPADQRLWLPRDQRPEPLDDSVPELQYGSHDNCGYRSLTPVVQATLGYRPADESSNGPFIVGIIVTHLSGVSIAFDVRRLTYEINGVTRLKKCLYKFLNSRKYYW